MPGGRERRLTISPEKEIKGINIRKEANSSLIVLAIISLYIQGKEEEE